MFNEVIISNLNIYICLTEKREAIYPKKLFDMIDFDLNLPSYKKKSHQTVDFKFSKIYSQSLVFTSFRTNF